MLHLSPTLSDSPSLPRHCLTVVLSRPSQIFVLDIFKEFFTPVREQQAPSAAWIKSHRTIAIRYLRGWFIVDALSVLPFDAIGVMMKANCGSSAETGDPGLLMLMKFVRLLRLLKRMRPHAL